MTSTKQDNYVKHRDKIIELASKGAVCYNCLAREQCNLLCSERNIDTPNSIPPCEEAWCKWSELTSK